MLTTTILLMMWGGAGMIIAAKVLNGDLDGNKNRSRGERCVAAIICFFIAPFLVGCGIMSKLSDD